MTDAQNGRYLVVDDDPVFTSILKKTGDRSGYAITAHETFSQARAVLHEQHNFDAIVIDYDLKEMTGLEAVEKITQMYPDLPVFLISASDRPLFVATEELPSYCGFISKWQDHQMILGELKDKARVV